jgi:hypothetical protein
MSFLPEIEHGAIKKRNAVLKRPARGKKKTGYLTKGKAARSYGASISR